jgi:hypothetical protein
MKLSTAHHLYETIPAITGFITSLGYDVRPYREKDEHASHTHYYIFNGIGGNYIASIVLSSEEKMHISWNGNGYFLDYSHLSAITETLHQARFAHRKL